VLLATRSFWEGVDIPGDDLSLVVLDKMPFPTPGDPLHSARMRAMDEAGDNSFAGYMIPMMTLALKQGFGRLIRRTSDRGVVAILDERLTSKQYGRRVRRDLPPARFSRTLRDVHRFFQVAREDDSEFALNIWVEPPSSGLEGPEEKRGQGCCWRWQALRLYDGRADGAQGICTDTEGPVDCEVNAASTGLLDLRRRVEQAGRSPINYRVEVRCSVEGRHEMLTGSSEIARTWREEVNCWKSVTVLAVRENHRRTIDP
jgi:ATP-dependent DNA helicase DinG